MPETRSGSIQSRPGLTNDTTKPESYSNPKSKQFDSEEASNQYNAMMIRNYQIQQEINSYARHYRIMN